MYIYIYIHTYIHMYTHTDSVYLHILQCPLPYAPKLRAGRPKSGKPRFNAEGVAWRGLFASLDSTEELASSFIRTYTHTLRFRV